MREEREIWWWRGSERGNGVSGVVRVKGKRGWPECCFAECFLWFLPVVVKEGGAVAACSIFRSKSSTGGGEGEVLFGGCCYCRRGQWREKREEVGKSGCSPATVGEEVERERVRCEGREEERGSRPIWLVVASGFTGKRRRGTGFGVPANSGRNNWRKRRWLACNYGGGTWSELMAEWERRRGRWSGEGVRVVAAGGCFSGVVVGWWRGKEREGAA
ncbi:hypothetical protein HAX54_046364 [Datura stramonium]|uniref:Uncharacterized protein n=1 Tax=Datura stramonium TaxID=4076 RepID=A0ABS8WGV4_DATST|nr:hypothetical protein [Datura stramonium]